MDTQVPLLVCVIAFGIASLSYLRRIRLEREGEPAAEAARCSLPVLVHSLNDDRCVGCSACVAICPTRVLELTQHKARVVRFADCIQCRQCEAVCPTQALVMHREDQEPPSLSVPEIDDCCQTAVPGMYLIGEVAGKPLVKNAANLGRAVVEHMRRTGLSPAPPRGLRAEGEVDVLIVGSGPAGLSAALTCQRHGLSYALLEKDHEVASTIAHYPAGKHLMAEPVEARNHSFLPVFDGTKEELLAAWKNVIQRSGLKVRTGELVESIEHQGGTLPFTVRSSVRAYRARRVVLAVGMRGTPRALGVPGQELAKVAYALDEAKRYAGQEVIVVGGGDSAVEAACALADAGAQVALSYRGRAFTRVKPANRARITEYGRDRVKVLLGSTIARLTGDGVQLRLADNSEVTLANRAAFVLIGGEPPIPWLERMGVRHVERPHRYALGATDLLVERVLGTMHAPERSDFDEDVATVVTSEPTYAIG